jgi:hypothetical protein
MQTHPLLPHPDHPPLAVSQVEARIIGRDANWLRMRWRVEGSQQLVVPPFAGEAYCELNLSPSERWNAYDFDGYRGGMRERPFPREPECTIRQGSSFVIFDAAIPVAGLPKEDCAMGLSAILEEQGGVKSYWALTHGEGKPDFHAPACFAAELPAPGAA